VVTPPFVRVDEVEGLRSHGGVHVVGPDPLAQVPDRVSIYEVGPRDGLQNERVVVPTPAKLRLIRALLDAGLTRIEATSFVSPKWVPQLADAVDLAQALRGVEGAWLSALVPNARGLERAMEAGVREVAVFLSASESHNRANVNKSIAQTLDAFEEVVPPALEAGMRVRGYVSTVWGCPYEGDVSIDASVRIAKRLRALGCYEISLGDTIGVGTPRRTRDVVGAFANELPLSALALHFHDTRGTALANCLLGLELGVRTIDASIAGLGGCPYAPGASGNLATEDLAYLLDGMGIDTGVNLDKLLHAGQVAAELLGRPLPGKVHQAGPFRRRPAP
jgi:hydroxymethylglutaryl-CoA lyase